MKKCITLSLITLSSLYATEIKLSPIMVESTLITEVAEVAQTSADVAQALSNNVPSIDMSRRSGIANDIILRGQKRDNITVEVDGTKIYGACPNRMDPPVSHIVANQIDKIEVIEGPYDVTTFGTLSGGVKITTKTPSKEEKVSLNLGFGSWNYNKFGTSVQGGNDKIRFNLSASMESSAQYKDGNGNTLASQIDNYVGTNPTLSGMKLQEQYHNMQAYTKKSAMAKIYIQTLKNQELRLSVTANRSDGILYANSKMDALYDDSNLYNIEYNINTLNDVYKNINIQYYHTDVDHPMDTHYRLISEKNPVITNWLTTTMDGIKLKNTFTINSYKLLIGLESSKRVWNGHYEKAHKPMGIKSIDEATTKNNALFTKFNKNFNNFAIEIGGRYDDTSITNDSFASQDYTSFGLNFLTTYHLTPDTKLFLALGQAYRVPDARELYFVNKMNKRVGTKDLQQVKNQEIDFGYDYNGDNFSLKLKTFYSQLSNYIYIQKGKVTHAFSNIDATVYGTELTTSYYINDDTTLDTGLAYKRGKKDKALSGQTDTDMADIAPLRGNIALNYEYAQNSLASLEVKASKRWDTIDSDNGEQVLAGWAVINTKIKYAINKKFDFTVGVNNLLNKTYAQSNTYADLILITAGGQDDVMLINESGRYIYTNLDFRF
jgi:iron complex outermembrane receptor protein